MEEEDRALISTFIKKITGLHFIEAIVLYGSIARGDYDGRSDIDLMIVINSENPLEYLSQITSIITDLRPHREIRPILTNLHDYSEEFYKNVFREGIVLFGKLVLTEDDLAIHPHYLISYDLTGQPNSKKSRISQKVYGYKSTKTVDGKKYEYTYPGLIDEFDSILVSRGTLILDIDDGDKFMSDLKELGVKYRFWNIWI